MYSSGTIGGLFSQILSGEEVSRESAIKFLIGAVEEYGKKVLHPSPETEEYLVEEIKKASNLVLNTIFCIIYSPLPTRWDVRLLQRILLHGVPMGEERN